MALVVELLRSSLPLLFAMLANVPAIAQSPEPPQAAISNGVLHVGFYLPDAKKGFYRGTRFDWSGVIRSLEYHGHNYYGPWFTATDPKVIDFVFEGDNIIAGPCSAITGPVEEFSTQEKALGFDEAKPGGTFIKLGVGVLRRPDAEDYNPYRLYEIVNGGKWSIRTNSDSIEFMQELSDPASGYAYRYTKTVSLTRGKPEMALEHKLENTGRRKIESSVYDHNFLVLDKQPTGPDYMVRVPFAIHAQRAEHADLARIEGNQFTYRKKLEGRETVSAEFSGFGKTAADYRISIENRKAAAGMQVTGDRPLSKENLWSIRSVLAVEPFIDISIEPGKTFTWRYEYTYYSLK
ncbi:MAG TPA: hypothetical protein VHU83_18030 [Bryobacteraceae bacterium]|jgi:hypothetical protein|nr:hypothetical protein [Bryobacteraceae bacterium]